MAGPLSNLPLGLNDLVGLRGTIGYPNDLAQSLQPIIDVRDHIGSVYAEILNQDATPATATNNQYTQITVPQGEMWLVLDAAVTGSTIATEMVRFRACWNFVQDVTSMRAGEEAASSLTDAIGVALCNSTLRGPFFAPGGSYLSAWVTRITTAATVTLRGRVRFLRLRR